MANSTFKENIFYHFILSEPELVLKFEPSYFSTKPLQAAFKIAKDYVIKYKVAPTAEQMKVLAKQENLDSVLPDDSIDILYAQIQSLAGYGHDWLYDEATDWAQLENVKKSIVDAASYLKLNESNIESGNAKELVEHVKSIFNKGCVIEFSDSDDRGSDFWNAESHKQKRLIRRSTGFPFIDYCLNGGYFDGALICFAGAPKIGKSLWMQNLCAASVSMGENSVYITLELPEEMVVSRIGSNMFSIPSLEYEKYSADEVAFGERIKTYRSGCFIKPGELLVKEFPTSTLSVIELESFLLSEEEKRSTADAPFKFKNVFIDYINIMKNYRNPNTENTYMKIKQLAEDIKAIGTKNKWAIITATQTNRSQFDANDVTASQISESTGLGATVDLLFGIIADPLMMAQGIYYLKCIYDRVSPQANKRKKYTCDFNYLRLAEDPNEGIEDTTVAFANSGISNTNDNSIKYAANRANSQKREFAPGAPNASINPNVDFEMEPVSQPSVNLLNQPVTQPVENTVMGSMLPSYTAKGLFD